MYTVISILLAGAVGFFCVAAFGFAGLFISVPLGALLGYTGATLDINLNRRY